MFYDPSAPRSTWPVAHDPFKALAAPRPIGWITTLSPDGVTNLAPYSFFNALSTDPHVVAFSSQGTKDSQRNAEATGAFVHNLVGWNQREAMNATSAAMGADVSEPEALGIAMAPSRNVAPPRVRDAPAAFECRYLSTTSFGGDYSVVFGEVVGVYVADAFVRDGMADTAAMRLLARLGYDQYAVVNEAFSMARPE